MTTATSLITSDQFISLRNNRNQSAFNFLSLLPLSSSVYPPVLPSPFPTSWALTQATGARKSKHYTHTNTQNTVWDISPWYWGQHKRGEEAGESESEVHKRSFFVLDESALLRESMTREIFILHKNMSASYTQQPLKHIRLRLKEHSLNQQLCCLVSESWHPLNYL